MHKMKTYVSQTDFIDAFKNSTYYMNNFSYDGLVELYEYFEQLEYDTGREIELDVIGICVEYAEYKTLYDFLADYDRLIEPKHFLQSYTYLDAIREHTEVIPLKEGFIIRVF